MVGVIGKSHIKSLYDSTREHFDKIANKYLMADIHRAADFEVIKSVVSKISGNEVNVVDVGCGPGQHLVLLSNLFRERSLRYNITGVDYDEVVLAGAKTNLRINRIKNVNLVLADVKRMPIKSSVASLAICMNNVLGNISSEEIDRKIALQQAGKAREAVLREINRILSQDGYVVISVYRRGTEHYSGDLVALPESSPKTGDYIVKMHSSNTTFYSHWFTPLEVRDLLELTNFDLIELYEKESRIIAVARKK
jgi:ubiquinone/menaquinone biosynthesis C-methylase UbiE